MNHKISVILILIALVASVLLSGCLDTPQSYHNIGVSWDVVNITRIHQNDNIKYVVVYIDPDCNCNKIIKSGKNENTKDNRDIFVNIIAKNSTVTRITLDVAEGNNNIIVSTMILEISNQSKLIDVYQ